MEEARLPLVSRAPNKVNICATILLGLAVLVGGLVGGGNDGTPTGVDNSRRVDVSVDTDRSGDTRDRGPLDAKAEAFALGWVALGEEEALDRDASRDAQADRQVGQYEPQAGQPLRNAELQPVPAAPNWHSLVCGPEFTWECSWALATIQCESSGRPWVVNWPYVGLWQVDVVLHRWTKDQMLDPEINTMAAHDLYVRNGRRPWPICGY